MLGGNPAHDRFGFRYWKDVRIFPLACLALINDETILSSACHITDINSPVPWQNSTCNPLYFCYCVLSRSNRIAELMQTSLSFFSIVSSMVLSAASSVSGASSVSPRSLSADQNLWLCVPRKRRGPGSLSRRLSGSSTLSLYTTFSLSLTSCFFTYGCVGECSGGWLVCSRSFGLYV